MKTNVQNRSHNSIKNSLFGLLNRLIFMLFPFVIRTVIIYKLGNEYVGLNSLFTSILNILNLTELGFGSAMVFYLYKPINDNNYEMISSILNLYKKIYTIIGSVILVLGLIIMPFLKFLIHGSYPADINIYILYLIYLSNTVISYFFFAYRQSLLKAYQRADVVSNISSIVHVVLYVLQIVVLLCFTNYYVYLVLLPLSTLVHNILIYFRSRKMYKDIQVKGKLSRELTKSIFSRTGALFGHKLGAVLITSMDNIIISTFLGLSTLAIFNNYYYIITSINGIIDILASSILFSIGNYLLNKNKDEVYDLFKKLTYINILIVGFCTTCLICLYQDFMLLWVGEENIIREFYVIVLFGVYFFSWKSRIVALNFKDAAGMWKNDRLKPYVGVVFNLLLDIVLIQVIGMEGVLISTIFVMLCIYFPWETYVLFKDLFKRSPLKYIFQYFCYIIITILCTAIVYWITTFIPVYNIQTFICEVLVVIACTSIIWILCTFRTSGYRFMMDKIKKFIRIGG